MRLVFILVLALVQLPLGLSAQPRVLNVIELFTSQGCSSCPPADRQLTEIEAKADHLLLLSWHVDYWDYMGWKDTYADPRHTKRQSKYSRVHGIDYVYTPQFIFNGHYISEGLDQSRVNKMVRKKVEALLEVRSVSDGLELRLQDAPKASYDILGVEYVPSSKVAVKRGENSGHALEYTNSVTDHRVVARWNAKGPVLLKGVRYSPGAASAVIIQDRASLRIIGGIDDVVWR